MAEGERSVVAMIETIGVEAAARRYVHAMSTGEQDENLSHVFWTGEDEHGSRLPVELLWGLLLAAIHACPDDDELLWRLGDGPIDNNCADPEIRRLLLQAQTDDAKVQRLFEAMRRMLPVQWDVHDGPWFDRSE